MWKFVCGDLFCFDAGEQLDKYGHMRVRALLKNEDFSEIFRGAPLAAQTASLGLLDDGWLREFQDSFTKGRCHGGMPLALDKKPSLLSVHGGML
jgi:hypothetical protein